MYRDGLPLTHFPVCLSAAFMVIPFRKGGKMSVTHFLRCHRRPDGVKEEGQGRELCCPCFLHFTCLAEVTLTSGGHWPFSPQKGPGKKTKAKNEGVICRKLPSNAPGRLLRFLLRMLSEGISGSDNILSIFTCDHILPQKAPSGCLLFVIQYWLCFLFPFPCAIPFLTATLPGSDSVFSVLSFVLSPLGFGRCQPPLPCPLLPLQNKTAKGSLSTEQSERGWGGQCARGNGQQAQVSWGLLGSHHLLTKLHVCPSLQPQTVMWIFNNVKGLNWL